MNIAYVCTDPGVSLARHNGSAAHVRGIVRAFGELGHRVWPCLAATDGAEELGLPVVGLPGSRAIDVLTARLEARGPGGRRIPLEERAVLRALRHVLRNGPVERALIEQWSARRPDLVYERYAPFSIACGAAAAALGLPHVLEVNAPLAWEGTMHRGQALPEAATLLERLAFSGAGRIVAVSDALRDHVVAEGTDASRVLVVPNGVDPDVFRPDGDDRRTRMPAGAIVIGFFGSLKPWHGLDELAQAFDALAGDIAELHLLVVGDGPGRVTIDRLAARRPGRVTRTGAVPACEIPGYLRATDIAVAPYPLLERFYFSPVKLLEYLACGRAIVASRIGQVESLIDDGRTGLLVEPGSVDALANAIALLALDPGARGRLGLEARRQAVHAHSWTLRAAEILDGAMAGVVCR